MGCHTEHEACDHEEALDVICEFVLIAQYNGDNINNTNNSVIQLDTTATSMHL